MGNKPKTDNFLRAIKNHATMQNHQLRNEVKQLQKETAEDTEKRARLDSEQLIAEKLEQKRSEQTALLAQKTKDGQKELFVKRAAMTDEVFRLAEEKLLAYTQTDAYREKLLQSAAEVAALFDGKPCTLYVSERDLPLSDSLAQPFGGSATVQPDASIRIGGVKGYCREARLIADETLDSKLHAQREWFFENADLKVI